MSELGNEGNGGRDLESGDVEDEQNVVRFPGDWIGPLDRLVPLTPEPDPDERQLDPGQPRAVRERPQRSPVTSRTVPDSVQPDQPPRLVAVPSQPRRVQGDDGGFWGQHSERLQLAVGPGAAAPPSRAQAPATPPPRAHARAAGTQASEQRATEQARAGTQTRAEVQAQARMETRMQAEPPTEVTAVQPAVLLGARAPAKRDPRRASTTRWAAALIVALLVVAAVTHVLSLGGGDRGTSGRTATQSLASKAAGTGRSGAFTGSKGARKPSTVGTGKPAVRARQQASGSKKPAATGSAITGSAATGSATAGSKAGSNRYSSSAQSDASGTAAGSASIVPPASSPAAP